jgi:hypothetical protein
MTSAPKHPWLTDGLIGRCSTCNELVYANEWGFDIPDDRRHPCFPGEIDYSIRAVLNPDNTPWLPGYTFYVEQASGARTGHKCRGHTQKVSRTYRVGFLVDMDGKLQHTRGPKPTDETFAGLLEAQQREKPGSNWYPGCEEVEL